MQPNPKQLKTLQILANDSETSKVLISFFEDLVRHYTDVRNMENPTNEDIKARKLFGDMVDDQVISRLKKKVEDTFNNDNFE